MTDDATIVATADTLPAQEATRAPPALSAEINRMKLKPLPPVAAAEEPAPGDAPKGDEKPDDGDDKTTKPNADDPDFEVTGDDGKKVTLADLPPNLQAIYKREITKARNKQRAAENNVNTTVSENQRIRKEADERIAALNAQVEEWRAKAEQPPKAADPLPRPKRDGFETPEAYETALETWASEEANRRANEATLREQAAADKKAKDDKAAEDKKRNDAAVAEQVKQWNAKREKAFEKYSDYVEVAESDKVTITPPMAQAIMEEDNGADVAYHLGKNPEEAERIAKLTPLRQVTAIGRLAERLAVPPPKKVSDVPAPITPHRGGRSVDSASREPEMDEYAKKRNETLAANRRGFFGQPASGGRPN